MAGETIRELIVLNLLSALATVTGVTVARAPVVAFDQGELPALGLFAGDEATVEGDTMAIDVNRMEVIIAGHAKGATGAAAETAAHALYGRALAAVMADYTRSGQAVNTRKTGLMMTFNDGAEGEIPLCGFELTLEVRYETLSADPTALAP